MFKNIGSNWVLMLVTMANAYVLLPFSLHTIGIEQYGVWLLITSFTGYLALLALGVPMASVRFITHDATAKDYKAMNRTIATCAGIYILIGLVTLLIGMALITVFDGVYSIPASMRSAARIAYVVVVATTAVSFLAQLPHGVLASHHNFVLRNTVQSIMILFRLVLTASMLFWLKSLLALAVAQLLPVIVEGVIMWMVVKRRYPEVQFDIRQADWTRMRQIFTFSVYVLILNIGVQLSFQTDSLVIGKMLDIGEIPYYSVANTIMVYSMQFVIGIAAVVMPMATRLHTMGAGDELRKLFYKWSKITLSLSVLGCLYLTVSGPTLIRLWVGEDFQRHAGPILQVLMLSGLIFLPVRGVALPVLMGIGKPEKATFYFLGTGVLNLVLSVVLARPYGLLGVAIGTAIPNVVYGISLLIISARELDFSVTQYLTRVVGLPFLGAIPVMLALLWAHRWTDGLRWIGLALDGIIICAVFFFVWTLFVYRRDPDINPREIISRWVGRQAA